MYYEQLTAEQKVIVSERVLDYLENEVNPLTPRHKVLEMLKEQLIEKHSAVEKFKQQQADLVNEYTDQIENLKRQIANLSR